MAAKLYNIDTIAGRICQIHDQCHAKKRDQQNTLRTESTSVKKASLTEFETVTLEHVKRRVEGVGEHGMRTGTGPYRINLGRALP